VKAVPPPHHAPAASPAPAAQGTTSGDAAVHFSLPRRPRGPMRSSMGCWRCCVCPSWPWTS